MYINTFKFGPDHVDCKLCTEYERRLGCTALHCPWLKERIEAGVVGYREALVETFHHDRHLLPRLRLLIKTFPGSLWGNVQHEQRMEDLNITQGYSRRRNTPAYYAAMYLLTANKNICARTANCFCRKKIEFDYATLRDISPHNYALYAYAQDLYCGTTLVSPEDLADVSIIDPEALRLMVNATLIARYGLPALQIKTRGVQDAG